MQISKDGDIVSDSRISWTKDVAKFIPVNKKGRLEDVGYMYFHNIVQDNQGRFYAIAEQYRRAVSAGGVALNALAAASGSSGGANNTKLVTEDLMIYEFSPEFELEGVEIFDKHKSNVHLPISVDYISIQKLGYFMDYYDGFDYTFTQTNKDNSMFAAGFTDYELSLIHI